jgi:RNA polymerase sigma-70 factor (ECF subfamily)
MNHDEQFEAVYRRYYGRVIRYLMRQFRLTAEDATDTAQDVFLRVFAVARDYSEDQSWRFIETVARNVAMNRIRAQYALKRRSADVAETTPSDRVSNTPRQPAPQEEAIVARETTAQLQAAISRLPAAQRSVLLLWLDDFTYVDIAQVLGISTTAVRSRLRDARRQLRDVFALGETDVEFRRDAAASDVVPILARQNLAEASAVSSDSSVEDALQELLQRVEALSAQQQHVSRQMDEYEVMLARHANAITEVASIKR